MKDTSTNNINEIKDLKERLTKVNHIFLHQDEPQFSDVDWDSVTEEFFLLKTRMEEILKTLPIDERDRIVWEDFEACVDRKTAEPLLWICGIDVSELLMYADTWMDYSPDVDIGLRVCPDEEGKDILYFSYRTYGITESSSFNLFDMEEKFRYTLDKAEAYKEAYLDETKESLTDEELEDEEKTTEEKFDKVSTFVSLKETLTKAYLHSPLTPSEIRFLEARLNRAIKTLSAEEFAKIVEKDLQTCVDNKTVNPLLWIRGLDLDEMPMGTTFEAKYSSDTRVAIEVGRETGKDKSLYLTVDIAELYLYIESFDQSNMGDKFNGALKIAEDGKEILAELEESVEELEDEELE